MDTSKWRQVLVPIDVYYQLVTMAHIEERTISGQVRVIFNQWMTDNLSKQDKKFLAEETEVIIAKEKNRRENINRTRTPSPSG
jgi:acyl-[acyl carrier protein]--UDP-N-acetylglucosamine O-acyltransferase